VSLDVRNSIYLWVGSIAFVLAFWAALRFDFLAGVSSDWIWRVLCIVAVINLGQFLWGLWRRRVPTDGEING
jgi:hypothetical protein